MLVRYEVRYVEVVAIVAGSLSMSTGSVLRSIIDYHCSRLTI